MHSPQDVANLVLGDMANFDQEHFRVLGLDTKNHVLTSTDVFVGSVNSTTIRTAEVFREAVRATLPRSSSSTTTRRATPRRAQRTRG